MITALHFHESLGSSSVEEEVNPEKAIDLIKSPANVWIDVVSEHKNTVSEILRSISTEYHTLILEDMFESTKPKIDLYDDSVFIVVKAYPFGSFKHSQINIVLGKTFLLTVRDSSLNLSKVMDFMKAGKQHTPDFVLYKILEFIYGQYYDVLESVDNKTAQFESESLKKPTPSTLTHILDMKKKLLAMHRILLSEREAALVLSRGNIGNIHSKTAIFMRDVYDDVVALIDMEENYREVLSDNIEIYMSSVNNSMNEAMKTLTLIASFTFVPALIAAFYGMNISLPFQKLEYGGIDYAFLFIIGLMISACGYLYFTLKRRECL